MAQLKELTLGLLVALSGCAVRGGGEMLPGPAALPDYHGGWRTLRAEHRVSIDATRSDGGHETRQLRGVIAVERPARFRLRGLGPGGIALFDVVYRAGEVKIAQALRDAAPGTPLGDLITAMTGDLAAAYGLDPVPSNRRVTPSAQSIAIDEPERGVLLDRFFRRGSCVAPSRLRFDNRARRYHVTVDVVNLVLDEPLDAALFD